MHGRQSALVVSTLVLLALSGDLSRAEAPGKTHCTAEFVNVLSPGLSSDPTSGVFHTDGGETGTIDCDGHTGTIGLDGRYGTDDPDTCTAGGEGWGVFSYTLDGHDFKDSFTFDFGGVSNAFGSGSFKGERYSGTFTFTPVEGDCVTSPATKVRVRTNGTVQG